MSSRHCTYYASTVGSRVNGGSIIEPDHHPAEMGESWGEIRVLLRASRPPTSCLHSMDSFLIISL